MLLVHWEKRKVVVVGVKKDGAAQTYTEDQGVLLHLNFNTATQYKQRIE